MFPAKRRQPLRLFLVLAGALALDGGLAAAQPSPPSLATSADAQQVVNKVQVFYDKAQTFQSDFHQEFVVKAYSQTKASDGHVAFSKPGKMSWTYSNPAGNRIVSDGNVLRVYEAANKQMYESPVGVSSPYPAAVSFLTGQGKLSDAFDFQLVDGDTGQKGTQLNFPGGYVLIGTPKAATPSYQKVLFFVDKSTSQVRRVLIVDAQGNLNKFTFQTPRVNDPIAPSEFVFTPPPGTNIVHP
jgi:outer membrane lipoprotein carrier protein